MYTEQYAVRHFHMVFGLPHPDTPGFEHFRLDPHVTNIEEEVRELREAAEAGDLIEAIDALVDLVYVVYGAATVLGVDLQPFFEAVHANNMTKLNDEGFPEYHPNGKVKKPANYIPVNLHEVFERIYNG